jgi:CMP-N-acetylneuraminic acid synthetase
MNILITICARGGSKGIPGKNIKLINGIPLIGYTINTSKAFKECFNSVDIALSTDATEIKKVAHDFGINTSYLRPDTLAGDTVGKIDAIKDVLEYYEKSNNIKYDYVLDLDVTSPLRTVDDLKSAFEILQSNSSAINIFSVSPASRSPYFNMVEIKENGFYAQVIRPSTSVFSRQAAPKVFDMNASFYFYKRAFFDLGYKGAITDKSLIYEVPHLCFDLDHPIDMEFLSFLLEKNKLGFSI